MPDITTPDGEPVIPAFPIVDSINRFISCNSFKPSFYATVKDQELDVDKLGDAIKNEYKSLPPELIDEYILATMRACVNLPVNTDVQVFITYDVCRIKKVEDDTLITLWTTQPMPKGYK